MKVENEKIERNISNNSGMFKGNIQKFQSWTKIEICVVKLKVIVALTLCKNGKIPSIGDGGFT